MNLSEVMQKPPSNRWRLQDRSELIRKIDPRRRRRSSIRLFRQYRLVADALAGDASHQCHCAEMIVRRSCNRTVMGLPYFRALRSLSFLSSAKYPGLSSLRWARSRSAHCSQRVVDAVQTSTSIGNMTAMIASPNAIPTQTQTRRGIVRSNGNWNSCCSLFHF
jgi:hypothetical protein